MRAGRLTAIAGFVLGFLALGTAAAWACNEPQISLGKSSGYPGDTVPFVISSIHPGAQYTVTFAGRTVGQGVAGESGVSGTLTVPDTTRVGSTVYAQASVTHEHAGAVTTYPSSAALEIVAAPTASPQPGSGPVSPASGSAPPTVTREPAPARRPQAGSAPRSPAKRSLLGVTGRRSRAGGSAGAPAPARGTGAAERGISIAGRAGESKRVFAGSLPASTSTRARAAQASEGAALLDVWDGFAPEADASPMSGRAATPEPGTQPQLAIGIALLGLGGAALVAWLPVAALRRRAATR